MLFFFPPVVRVSSSCGVVLCVSPHLFRFAERSKCQPLRFTMQWRLSRATSRRVSLFLGSFFSFSSDNAFVSSFFSSHSPIDLISLAFSFDLFVSLLLSVSLPVSFSLFRCFSPFLFASSVKACCLSGASSCEPCLRWHCAYALTLTESTLDLCSQLLNSLCFSDIPALSSYLASSPLLTRIALSRERAGRDALERNAYRSETLPYATYLHPTPCILHRLLSLPPSL